MRFNEKKRANKTSAKKEKSKIMIKDFHMDDNCINSSYYDENDPDLAMFKKYGIA